VEHYGRRTLVCEVDVLELSAVAYPAMDGTTFRLGSIVQVSEYDWSRLGWGEPAGSFHRDPENVFRAVMPR
jgi:hypothetical protein